jgi:S1/P1 nuclease
MAELTFTSGALWGQRRKFRMNGSYNYAIHTAVTKRVNIAVALIVASLVLFPFDGLAWNIPGHMLSGAIAYQILQRENPSTIPTVRPVLEKNSWYETRGKAQLDKQPASDRNEMLFMLAARWADDIRTRDKAESRLPWHYIDFPFKPEGEPASIKAMPPPQENILTAIAVNERAGRTGSDARKRGIALSWLFHLIGDIHPPVHAVTLFSREYPNGDRGDGDFCVRVVQDRAALSLHRLWDGLIRRGIRSREKDCGPADGSCRLPASQICCSGISANYSHSINSRLPTLGGTNASGNSRANAWVAFQPVQ